MAAKTITDEIQQGILILLIFDSQRASLLSSVCEASWFITPFDVIFRISSKFISTYNANPSVHIYELLKNEIMDEALREECTNLIEGFETAWNDKLIRPNYIISELDKFIRRSGWRQTIEESLIKLQQDQLDEVEILIDKQMKKRIIMFDEGGRIDDEFLEDLCSPDNRDREFQLGIQALDEKGYGLLRGELYLFVAPPKCGKSWHLITVGREGLFDRKKVLHISLEMSEKQIMTRYVQSIFSVARREAEGLLVNFIGRSDKGEFLGLERERIEVEGLGDIRTINKIRADEFLPVLHDNLIVKEFPSGSLSIGMLKVYLNNLKEMKGFTPDIIIVDYADLMKMEGRYHELRHDLDKLYVDLRGISTEHDVAMCTASQVNREGKKSGRSDDVHVAESFGKIATADMVITYSQRPRERELGLARIFVSNSRRFVTGVEAVISQSYAMGQFSIDSIMMDKTAYQLVLDSAQ